MLVLGINAFHGDSSACLVRDGQLVAAAEEERFRRIKHWAGFPSEAIRYCLAEAGIGLAQVDHVAINQDGKANLGKKLSYTLLKRPDLGMVLDRLRNKRERAGVADVQEVERGVQDSQADKREGPRGCSLCRETRGVGREDGGSEHDRRFPGIGLGGVGARTRTLKLGRLGARVLEVEPPRGLGAEVHADKGQDERKQDDEQHAPERGRHSLGHLLRVNYL